MFKEYLYRRWLLEADKGGAGGGKTGDAGKGANEEQDADAGETLAYDTWIEKQPDQVRSLLETQTKGLKSALDSERESRKDVEKQLRIMAKKAEDGSDAQKQLTAMADQSAAADQRADFYEEAHRQGVSNLKLAYLTATSEDLIDGKGRVNFDQMKKDYPELFGKGKPAPKGNAGDGTNEEPQKGGGMNSFIRRSSGRTATQ